MLDATRLTREGRLAEATALIQQTLGFPTVDDVEPLPVTLRGVPTARSSAPTEPATCTAPAALEAPSLRPAAQACSEPVTDPHAARPRARVNLRPWPGPPSPLARSLGFTIPLGRSNCRLAPKSWPGTWIDATYADAHGSRAYRLYVPSNHRSREHASSLVVMLHGCTQDPDDFAAGTGMNDLAESQGFLVVYPEQDASANHSKCWNWFLETDQQRDRGEPALIAGIARRVMVEYGVDSGRLFVAGLSAGGAMAAILGAAYPDLFAAVGVHSGLAPGSAHDLPSAFQAMRQGGRPGRPLAHSIPLILFHGDRDTTVSPRNADHLVRHWIATASPEPLVTLARGEANGKPYTRTTYRDLVGQLLVERWTIHGAGHAWSGGHPGGSFTDPAGPDASAEFARFFHSCARSPRR